MSFFKSYAWDVESLATDLKRGEVSQSFRLKVFLLCMLLYYASGYPLENMGAPYSDKKTLLVELVLRYLILIWGAWSCFRINEKADNREFIDRFICLSLPITIRLIPVAVVLVLILKFLDGTFSSETALSQDYFESSAYLLMDVAWILWVRKYFVKMAHIAPA